jgi:hypothetical protein
MIPRLADPTAAPPKPVHMDSERELATEFDSLAAKLSPPISEKEWTDRLAAMVGRCRLTHG